MRSTMQTRDEVHRETASKADASERHYQKRVKSLDEKAASLARRHTALTSRRGLEMEGYNSEINILRRMLRDAENNLFKLKNPYPLLAMKREPWGFFCFFLFFPSSYIFSFLSSYDIGAISRNGNGNVGSTDGKCRTNDANPRRLAKHQIENRRIGKSYTIKKCKVWFSYFYFALLYAYFFKIIDNETLVA